MLARTWRNRNACVGMEKAVAPGEDLPVHHANHTQNWPAVQPPHFSLCARQNRKQTISALTQRPRGSSDPNAHPRMRGEPPAARSSGGMPFGLNVNRKDVRTGAATRIVLEDVKLRAISRTPQEKHF